MYVDGVRERIEEIKEKVGVKESDLEYPTLTIQSVGTPKVEVNASENDPAPTEDQMKSRRVHQDSPE